MSWAVPLTLLDQRRPRDPVELEAFLDCVGETAGDLLLQGRSVEIDVDGLEPFRPLTLRELRRELPALQSAGRHLLRTHRRPLVRVFVAEAWSPPRLPAAA